MNALLLSALLVSAAPADLPAPAAVQRALRIFDLRFLREAPPQEEETLPPWPRLNVTSWDEAWMDGLDSIEIFGDDAGEEPPDGPIDAERLEEVIRAFIAEDSWSNTRNRLHANGDRLVVIQTSDVLERLGRLIAALEARAGRALSLEAALVPRSALDRAAPGWDRPGASPYLDGEAIERALAAAGAEGALSSGLVREGWKALRGPLARSRRLIAHEVNQTGAVPVFGPVVESIREGNFLEARALAAPGGGWFRVELRLGRARLDGEGEMRKLPSGDLELLRRRHERIETSVIVPAGRTAILGAFSAPAAEEGGEPAPAFAGLLRVRRAPLPGAAEFGRDEPFRILEAGLLLRPLPGRARFGQGAGVLLTEDGAAGGSRALLLPQLLEASIRQALPEPERTGARVILAGSAAFLGASEPGRRAAAARLEEMARDLARMAQVEVWQGEAAAAELDGGGRAGALLDPAWIERMATRPGWRCRIAGIGGAGLSLASVRSRAYIADVEKVSGGTENVVVEVAQPVVGEAGGGILLDAIAELVPGETWARLRVRGDAARPPRFERQVRVRASQAVDVVSRTGKAPAVEASGEWVAVDLPDEDSDRWQHMITVPLGRPVLLNALPDPANPGKARALVAVVSAFAIDLPPGDPKGF